MSAAKGRVLIAEDVSMLAMRISDALAAHGYHTAIAGDGAECLAMVESYRPDLLILDIMMPKVHGIEVMRRLQPSGLGVIVCTSKDFKTEMVKVEEFGAIDVIIKPLDTDDLIAKVDRYFARDDRPVKPAAPNPAPAHHFRHQLKSRVGVCELWGTRGSIPVSDPQYVRHGGNTSCMCIRHGEHVMIFDAGSGIRPLGLDLLAGGPRRIHMFITHTHWDHIQGFPFFTPAYVPGYEITMHAVEGFGKDLESLFRGQLDQDYFPVEIDDMEATLEFRRLPPEPLQIGDARITWEFTQHPGATVGYRIDLPGVSVAWVPDNEFLKGHTGSPFELARGDDLVGDYEAIIRFLENVDILMHEGQYTQEEYIDKVGWGHSSVPNACVLAKLCNAKRWVVVHHDPMHDDNFLQHKLSLTRQLMRDLGHGVEVTHGFDGWREHLA
jgi:CheY-like chemotaxis protein/phosphoribosyl 1,2-cyclic phosphodiesterase